MTGRQSSETAADLCRPVPVLADKRQEALELIEKNEGIAVIIADQRMPT
jgi:hypothetical protein